LDIVPAKLLSVHNYIKREHNIKETEKKQKAEQLALFEKPPSGNGTSSSFFRKKKLKKNKSKSKVKTC